MPEQIYKLTPDRDLQCYFLTPSSMAAMSNASSSGFTVSGKWRQQFDWAVVEWNRDNTFEHPVLRYLPDGDLSGLTLTYEEERTGCAPLESNLVPVVDWDNLRVWADDANGVETLYHVNLLAHATPIGSYTAASATMTVVSIPSPVSDVNHIGLALLDKHYYYNVVPGNSPSDIAKGIAEAFASDADFAATYNDATVTITWKPNNSKTGYGVLRGANGNRITVYGFCTSGEPVWKEPYMVFNGGEFPAKYSISIQFQGLQGTIDFGPRDKNGNLILFTIPTNRVRKLRWTWAADLQPREYVQTEYSTTISNWTVTGANRIYSVAGPGSRRIENTDSAVVYTGTWSEAAGNYSGSRIHETQTPGDSCLISYTEAASHQLFVGLRRFPSAPLIAISVDGQTPLSVGLSLLAEDVLIRQPLGIFPAGPHSVTLTHTGVAEQAFYFDFLEIAYPSTNLPDFPPQPQLAMATDWDTYHSQSIAPERTAWLIQKLGFFGRVNHYVGALWFYELIRTGTQYASLTLTLNQQIPSRQSPTIVLAIAPTAAALSRGATLIKHLVLPDDTTANVALALAGLINLGTNLVWASASGNQLTLTARFMGEDGNGVGVQLDLSSRGFTATANGSELSGGVDGTPYDLEANDLDKTLIAAAQYWKTDLKINPAINRAARDWHKAYFIALKGYGLDAVAAFSTELGNGEPATAAGIAQCYPDGTPVILNTPALQTNFSPAMLPYWTRVYLEMAKIQQAAGLVPYLQSGEVQWWYIPKADVGMTFYDAYTKQQFQSAYGVDMQVILSNTSDPAAYPNEAAFLPTLIGAYTAAIRTALKHAYPNCRYEVLYPNDVNDFPLMLAVNYPVDEWTPENLDCLKTESFGFTGGLNLVKCTYSMNVSAAKGFPSAKRSHLVGISDIRSPWKKEIDIAQSQGLESVVLFALDQYCLIGYDPPPFVKSTGSRRQG